ncbi:MAG: substrate-binding domain-containing protein [Gemmatimonadetes bacterium]|nr:substrate-binding domain-containing protein [Gemmatimonadota bacterium]
MLSANADIAGVFCPNESSTFGMLLSARAGDGGEGEVRRFDASEGLVEALRAGQIDALTVQNPVRMGYLGVKTAVDHLRGKMVEARVDTGVGVITRDSLSSPEARELLSPELLKAPGGT